MEQPASLLSLVLVLIAIGLAWFAGYRSRFHKFPGLKRNLEQDYFVGLNYLLNDEPDDAIDIFIDALEVSSATLATHLALGTLLRRRGKFDKSIAHYQSLLESPEFSSREICEIKLQLARSFLAAGLLDRAERLLEELMETPPVIREMALGLAINVFQKERDWRKALAAATDLMKICTPHRRQDIQLQASHFYCELAELAMKGGEYETARDELKRAAQMYRHNVRIYLLQGRLETLADNPRDAVKALLKVAQFDPAFAHEAAEDLRLNLQKTGMEKQVSPLLDHDIRATNESSQILDSVAEIIRQQGEESALHYLLPQLKARPSLSLLSQSLSLAARRDPKLQAQVLELASSLLSQHLLHSPHYRCENCGFELKSMHWLCPGCSRWGMVKPLDDRISYSHDELTTPS